MAFGGGLPTWGQALLFVWRVSVAILVVGSMFEKARNRLGLLSCFKMWNSVCLGERLRLNYVHGQRSIADSDIDLQSAYAVDVKGAAEVNLLCLPTIIPPTLKVVELTGVF
mmetsp:Transcript_18244/g.27992  ORF Transcript_18244/g.27992 Transcript_18244/m.27992 type:complete len:111 (-) Transcript_18244:62-394(-)